MTILGVDYGRAKLGLAIGETGIADPWKVVRVNSMEDALGKVESACAGASEDKQVVKVVVGISEGEMGKEQEEFAQALEKRIGVPVIRWDETLSTQDAQARALEAGISRGRRKKLEDAFAASVMLQSYLDSH